MPYRQRVTTTADPIAVDARGTTPLLATLQCLCIGPRDRRAGSEQRLEAFGSIGCRGYSCTPFVASGFLAAKRVAVSAEQLFNCAAGTRRKLAPSARRVFNNWLCFPRIGTSRRSHIRCGLHQFRALAPRTLLVRSLLFPCDSRGERNAQRLRLVLKHLRRVASPEAFLPTAVAQRALDVSSTTPVRYVLRSSNSSLHERHKRTARQTGPATPFAVAAGKNRSSGSPVVPAYFPLPAE